MSRADNYSHLILSVVVISLGNALFSGTDQALIYDSLKQDGEEEQYESILTKINSCSILALAVASIIGGYLYALDPRLPFLATALGSFLALLLASFLTEPLIDSEKFSLRRYVRQNLRGFSQLFKVSVVRGWVLKLILVASFVSILNAIFDYALAIDFGYSEKSLGILFSLAIFLAAAGNHFYRQLKNLFGEAGLLLFTFMSLIFSTLLSPIFGLALGTTALLWRFFLYPLPEVQASNTINQAVSSGDRATTLSTFTMLYKLPYVATAFLIGLGIDRFGAKYSVAGTSAVFAALGLVLYLSLARFSRKPSAG